VVFDIALLVALEEGAISRSAADSAGQDIKKPIVKTEFCFPARLARNKQRPKMTFADSNDKCEPSLTVRGSAAIIA
jgi:hypothetical protein